MSESPIWTPSPDRIAGAAITAFRERFDGTDFETLHRSSIDEPGRFWRAVWGECGVAGDPGDVAFDAADGSMRGARFFPNARLNFAENLLRAPSDAPAVVATSELGVTRVMTRRELYDLVARLAAAMRAEGVRAGDRVAAWMPNVPETVAIMLAAASIGAVFSSTSPDFGVAGVLDRFAQIEPVLLFAAGGYQYGGKTIDCLARLDDIVAQLPTVRRTLVVPESEGIPSLSGTTAGLKGLEEWIGGGPAPALEFVPLPFDHPLAILFSSGTTGVPKCIVHRAGGILVKHLAEHQLQCDVRAGDRVFYFTTCGWMMWNWLISALASDATIVLYDGSPFHPAATSLFDLAERERLTLFGISAKYVDALRKSGARPRDTHDLSALRTICSTGSPLVAEGFDYVYDAIRPDVHLASISGGTDLCGCLVMGDPTRPVFRGEIQGPALGVAAEVWDDDAKPAAPGLTGELVCTRPFPSMPLGFLADDTGERYQAAYFERFAGHDVWSHGDFALRTEVGGFAILGRSDATLNPGGVRIGTAEIYRQVEALPEVAEALAIGQPWEGDVRIVLFVRLADGVTHDTLLDDAIRDKVRRGCSPRHVPARIVSVADLPRTRSGKLAELAVADVVAGREVRNREALANPEALENFRQLPQLAG